MIGMVIGVDPTNMVDLIKDTSERQIKAIDDLRRKCYTYSYLYQRSARISASTDRYDKDRPTYRFQNPLNRPVYLLEIAMILDDALKSGGQIRIENDGTAIYETDPLALEGVPAVTFDGLRGLRVDANKYVDIYLKTSDASATVAYVGLKVGVYE